MNCLSLPLDLVGVLGWGVAPLLPRPLGEAGGVFAPSSSILLLVPLLWPLLTAGGGVDWTHLFLEGGGVRVGGDLTMTPPLSTILLWATRQVGNTQGTTNKAQQNSYLNWMAKSSSTLSSSQLSSHTLTGADSIPVSFSVTSAGEIRVCFLEGIILTIGRELLEFVILL